MFANIGEKIKILAIAICVVGIIGSITYAIVLFTQNVIGLAIVYLIVGPISSWIGCFLLYGFGQLITNTDKLVNQNKGKQDDQKD